MIITRNSVKGVYPVLDDKVQAILDSIPEEAKGVGHGRCGLPICLTAALDDGLDVSGAEAASVIVQRVGKPMHGYAIKACKSCAHLVEYYNLRFLTDDGEWGG